MLQPREPINLIQMKFSQNCKLHKQPFNLICLHTSCQSSYKLLCLKCKKQKHYQHPNRVLTLCDFYQMLSANRMQFIENSLGMSLVGIRNKLVYVSNFRIFILEKQAMLIENARMIHGVVCRICQEKRMLKGWVQSLAAGVQGEGQQQQSQSMKDPQTINQSLQLIKKHITYNPIQSTIRITSQPVNTMKVQLQKLSQSTKSLIDDIRQYLMKIIEIMIQQQVDDQDIEYIEHEDVDEKVFNIDVKRKNEMEINQLEVRYKVEELQGMFQGLLKGEMEKHQEHVESQVVKLEQEIKIKQEIIQNIRKRSASKATTAIVQDYQEEDYFGQDLVAYTKKDPFAEIVQAKGVSTLPTMDNKFTYISLKGNDNSANKLLKNNPINSSNNNNNNLNSSNKKAQKNAQQTIKSPQQKPLMQNSNTRFIRNNKRVQNTANGNTKLQQQNEIKSLRYNNKKKCSLFYGESTDENGLRELLNIEQTSFNTSKQDFSRYYKRQDRQQDNSKLDSQSMLLEEEIDDEKGRMMKVRQEQKEQNNMLGKQVNELQKEVDHLTQQVSRLKQQNLLSLEQLIKTRQQSQQERSQLLQKIKLYQQQQQDQLMKQINKELGWSLQINRIEANKQQEGVEKQQQVIGKLIEEKEELQGRVGELQEEIKGFEQREAVINSDLGKMKQESINKQQQIENLKQQHLTLQQQNTQLQQLILKQQQQQQIEKNNFMKEQKQLVKKMETEKQKKETVKQHLEEQLIKLQKQLKEKLMIVESNRLQLQEKNRLIIQMQGLVDHRRQQIDKLVKERSQERDTVNEQMQKLNQQIKQKDMQLQQLTNQYSTLQQQTLTRQQQTLTFNSITQQHSSLNNQLSYLTAQLQQQQLYIQTLIKQQVKQKQQLAQQYKRELQFRQKQLNQQLDKAIVVWNQRQCEGIEEKIMLERKVEEVRLLLQGKSEELQKCRQSYRRLEDKCREMKQSKQQLQCKQQQLQTSLSTKNNHITQLNSIINTLNQQLNQSKSQHKSLQQQLQHNQQQLQQQITNSNSEILQLKKAILKTFQENNKLTQKSMYYEKKAKQCEIKMNELVRENVVLGDKLEAFESSKLTSSQQKDNNTTNNNNPPKSPTNQHLISSKHNEIRQLIQIITNDMHLLQEKVKQNTVIEKVYLKELDRKRTQNRKLRQEIDDCKGGSEEKAINTINNDKIVDNGLLINARPQSVKNSHRRITVKEHNITTNSVQTKLIINPPSNSK